MSITRDDLQAAARAGRLQYAEVDSLLIFLMQRHKQINKKSTSAPVSASRCYLSSFVAILLATSGAVLIAPGWAFHLPLLALLPFTALCSLCRAASKPRPRRYFASLTWISVALMLIAFMPLVAIALNEPSIFEGMVWQR